MDKSKNENQRNVYKYTTFGLLSLVIILGLIFALNYYGNLNYKKGFDEGSQLVQNTILQEILSEVKDKGYVTLNYGENQSLVLVHYQVAQDAQTVLVEDMFKLIEEDGSVTVYLENQSMVLVPYVENN